MGYSNKTFKLSRLENCHYPNVDQYNQTHKKLHIIIVIITNKLNYVQ